MELLRQITNVELADAMDIAVVAVFVYGFLAGLRRIRVRSIARVLFALMAVYTVAQMMDLRLTVYLFHVAAAAVGLGLAILYHGEVRGALERAVGRVTSPRRIASRAGSNDAPAWVSTLVGVLHEMNRLKIGALIVIRGRDNLDRHLTGGTPLDGLISEPLLWSIFDPNSIGHDGGVIIEGERITRFSAHLPLSTDFEQLGQRGTRHTAALGLAERSDALCLVASEERGHTSVARDGRLRTIEDQNELERVLSDYVRGLTGASVNRSPFWSWDRLQPKIVAVVLAYGLWFVFAHESAIEYRSYTVPVEFVGLEPGVRVLQVSPPEVKIVLSGPRRAFYFVDSRDIAMHVTLFDVTSGELEVTLTASEVIRPDSLTFANIFPRIVNVTLVEGEAGPP